MGEGDLDTVCADPDIHTRTHMHIDFWRRNNETFNDYNEGAEHV